MTKIKHSLYAKNEIIGNLDVTVCQDVCKELTNVLHEETPSSHYVLTTESISRKHEIDNIYGVADPSYYTMQKTMESDSVNQQTRARQADIHWLFSQPLNRFSNLKSQMCFVLPRMPSYW